MTPTPLHVYCNGARCPKRRGTSDSVRHLEWRRDKSAGRNINLGIPRFVDAVLHLPPRILDLLEIAAYVFAADRMSHRGSNDAVEFHRWARCFKYHIKVRDYEFWSNSNVTGLLGSLLKFMTGDKEHLFEFQSGHRTDAVNLFDEAGIQWPRIDGAQVVLFSGGLDSLAGAAEALTRADSRVCLVSHQSNPGTVRTQKALCGALEERYPRRVIHLPFTHNLHRLRAAEESQRSRSFLFSSIAFAAANAIGNNEFYICENGFTSLGWAERQDLMNARASRTTHPKTINLVSELLTLVQGAPFKIATPFAWNTKADIFSKLRDYGLESLVSSAVSCSKTRNKLELASQCGGCSQCVERRFASYAAQMERYDSDCGIYAHDFIADPMSGGDVRTTVIDFLRAAKNLASCNLDHFYYERLEELGGVCDGFPSMPEPEVVENVWKLCRRHGSQTLAALGRMRDLHDDLGQNVTNGSLLDIVARREYLRSPVQLMVDRIAEKLGSAIPVAFRRGLPKSENVLNDQIEAILKAERAELQREFPVIRFGLARAIPDHSIDGENLFIEGKYIRGGTSPSKVTSGIAEDIVKYGESVHTLFVVYDPNRAITDDTTFKEPFVSYRQCTITIIR